MAISDTLRFTIWRDSVCAGDDGDAPHEATLVLRADVTLRELAGVCLRRGYLASITGGRATWILEARRPLAVVAQEWEQSRFLVAPETPASSLVDFAAKAQVHFRYLRQTDPERVFLDIQHGEKPPCEPGRATSR